MGFEIKEVHGHIEIHCINSASRCIWYLYAITEDSYNDIEDWFNSEYNKYEEKDYLFQIIDQNIIPITIKL